MVWFPKYDQTVLLEYNDYSTGVWPLFAVIHHVFKTI